MKSIVRFLIVLLTVSFMGCTNETLDETNLDSRMYKDEICETGFAYCEKAATCFSEDGFQRWGWRLGPFQDGSKEECEIYAGAGKCVIDKGVKVGYYEIGYDDGKVVVQYHAYEGSLFYEAHLYVGNAMYPTLPNGRPTVAPGQYPYKQSFPDGTDFVEFRLEDEFEGEIYVIAHSEVCYYEEK